MHILMNHQNFYFEIINYKTSRDDKSALHVTHSKTKRLISRNLAISTLKRHITEKIAKKLIMVAKIASSEVTLKALK